MREILFRGKRITDNAWIKGDLQTLKKGWGLFITINGNGDKVFTETVGQYTGLKDKNGKRIFEGDIVVDISPRTISNKPFVIKMGFVTGGYGYWKLDRHEYLVVIGNVHDNKELLHDREV